MRGCVVVLGVYVCCGVDMSVCCGVVANPSLLIAQHIKYRLGVLLCISRYMDP